MPEKNAAEIAEWYDKLAVGYDELYAAEQSLKYDAVLSAVGQRRFEIILDVGCGTGLLLNRLQAISNLVVGIDVSREMLFRAKALSGNGGVSLIRADLSSLPIREHAADCVLSISLLKEGGALSRQLRDLSRVSRPDGVLVGTMFRDGGAKLELDKLGLVGDVKCWDLSAREILFLTRRAML